MKNLQSTFACDLANTLANTRTISINQVVLGKVGNSSKLTRTLSCRLLTVVRSVASRPRFGCDSRACTLQLGRASYILWSR
jgi:hypothetical protein